MAIRKNSKSNSERSSGRDNNSSRSSRGGSKGRSKPFSEKSSKKDGESSRPPRDGDKNRTSASSKEKKFSGGRYNKKSDGKFRVSRTGKITDTPKPKLQIKSENDPIRLNKFIANCGICSRREADDLIVTGIVTVNGKAVTTVGTKIRPHEDEVRYDGQLLTVDRHRYVLLNKPKGFEVNPKKNTNQKNVIELVRMATKERIYPVGKLGKDDLGLLLFTNDDAMAKRLCHPKLGIQLIFQVTTKEKVNPKHLDEMRAGLEIEEGVTVVPDDVQFVEGSTDRRLVGIKFSVPDHNMVNRFFAHFKYTIVKLDRVDFAGLTKKNLPRGKWRLLTDGEIQFMRMNNSKK